MVRWIHSLGTEVWPKEYTIPSKIHQENRYLWKILSLLTEGSTGTALVDDTYKSDGAEKCGFSGVKPTVNNSRC